MLDVLIKKPNNLAETESAAARWSAHIGLAIMIIAYTTGAILLSRLPASNFAELSPFWPVTGIAIALLRYRLSNIFWLIAGLMLWSLLSKNTAMITVLLPLTLAGPLLYTLISRRPSSRFNLGQRMQVRVNDYLPISLFALIPSAFIGSFLYSVSLPQFQFIDTLFVYGLADFLGVLIFLPLTESLHSLLVEHKKPQFQPLILTLMLAFLPAVFAALNYPAYASAFEILLFPLFTIMICRYNRQSLIFSSFLLAIVITLTAGFGVSQLEPDKQIEEFLLVSFWLIAFLFAVQILHQTFHDKMTLHKRSQFQATHNERTNIPNKRQLESVFQPDTFDFLSFVQVKDRDTLNQTYSSQDVENLEKQIARHLQLQLPQCSVFHISEMRFALLSSSNIVCSAETLQDIEIELQGANVYLNLCWGLVKCHQDFNKTMAYASAALNIAMQQPIKRIFGPGGENDIVAQLEQLDKYQELLFALENDGLKLFQQSILDLENNDISCAEVLSRIEVKGKITSPYHFIDVLKSFDALSQFDRIVIEKTFRVFKLKPLPSLQRININITGATLSDQGFIPWLESIIDTIGLPQLQLCFEITESDWIRHWDIATANAQALSDRGFLIAIDDFGAGLASFEYLAKFPMANIIKLDGAFVKGLAHSDKQKAFVDATIIIANSRGLKVCAEFVDNQATQDYLKSKAVKYAQGYFIAEPQAIATASLPSTH